MDWKRLIKTLLPLAIVLMVMFIWQGVGGTPQEQVATQGAVQQEQRDTVQSETQKSTSQKQKAASANKNDFEAQAREVASNYTLTDKEYEKHIVERHGADSTYGGKSKFLPEYDLRAGIDEALTSEKSRIRENTNGRDGYLFELTYDEAIGTDDKGHKVHTIRVVMGADGFVVTAFPVK